MQPSRRVAPVRRGVAARFYVCGREYMAAVAAAMVGAREEMLMYAPKDVQDRIRDGRPAVYDGPGFGKRDIRTERDFENPHVPSNE